MTSILIGSFLISLVHALIPNHWLPVLIVAKQEQWSRKKVISVSFIASLAHIASTAVVGFIAGVIGTQLGHLTEQFSIVVVPIFLATVGFYFVLQHFKQRMFHVGEPELKGKSRKEIIWLLIIAMLLSPCVEIVAFFLSAGSISFELLMEVFAIYFVVSLLGTAAWTQITFRSSGYDNWPFLEKNAGLISGSILILTGALSFLLYNSATV